MWVQYKQEAVITPQQQSTPQIQSVRHHTTDVANLNKSQQANHCATSNIEKNSGESPVFREFPFGLLSAKQNDFTENALENARFSSQAMLFTDDLQAITSPQVAQTVHHEATHPHQKAKQHNIKTRDAAVLRFACFYLLGAAAAGILYAMLSGAQAQYFSYYVLHFIEAITNASAMEYCIHLCSICVIGLTTVILLGLSAFGLPLLFVFLFLKGIGSGVLLLQFFAQYQWRGLLYYFTSIGTVDICLATGLCLLACTAAKSASTLFRVILSPKIECDGSTIRQLTVQYLVLLFCLIVICLLCAVIFCGFFGDFQLG